MTKQEKKQTNKFRNKKQQNKIPTTTSQNTVQKINVEIKINNSADKQA